MSIHQEPGSGSIAGCTPNESVAIESQRAQVDVEEKVELEKSNPEKAPPMAMEMCSTAQQVPTSSLHTEPTSGSVVNSPGGARGSSSPALDESLAPEARTSTDVSNPSIARKGNEVEMKPAPQPGGVGIFKKLFRTKPEAGSDAPHPLLTEGSDRKRKMTRDDFEDIAVLGKGSFAKVVLSRRRWKEDPPEGQLFALKMVDKTMLLQSKRTGDATTERNVMMKADYPFILTLHATFQTEAKLVFVLEYMAGGDFDKHLNCQPSKTVSQHNSKLYAAQVFLGLSYLHQNRVIYRDLKPENMLLTAEGHCVLADFGLSKDCSESTEGQLQASSFVGSPFYMSPEVLRQQVYTQAADIWGFGVLLYRLVCGRVPFTGRTQKEVFDNILYTELLFPTKGVEVDGDVKDLISKCLVKDPTKRITGPDIRLHRYWDGQSWDDVLAKKLRPEGWVTALNPLAKFDANFVSEVSPPSFKTVPHDIPPLAGGQHAQFSGFTCTGACGTTKKDEAVKIPEVRGDSHDAPCRQQQQGQFSGFTFSK